MSGTGIRVHGLDQVLANLNAEAIRMTQGGKRGLIRGGLIIMRGSMDKTPVQFGNLRASHYMVMKGTSQRGGSFNDKGGDKAKLQGNAQAVLSIDRERVEDMHIKVGASAYYAIFVHEDMAAGHRGKGRAKFLELSVQENQDRVLAAMAEEMRKEL